MIETKIKSATRKCEAVLNQKMNHVVFDCLQAIVTLGFEIETEKEKEIISESESEITIRLKIKAN